jgi:hypothetical protein
LYSIDPAVFCIDPPHEILPLHIGKQFDNSRRPPAERAHVAKTQLSLARVHMKLVAVQLRTWSGSVERWPCATRNGVSIDQSAACSCVAHDFASLASSGISAVEQIGRRSLRRDGAAAEAEAAFLQLDAVSEAVEDDDMAKLKEGPAV